MLTVPSTSFVPSNAIVEFKYVLDAPEFITLKPFNAISFSIVITTLDKNLEGLYPVTLTATDTISGLSATQTFKVTV